MKTMQLTPPSLHPQKSKRTGRRGFVLLSFQLHVLLSVEYLYSSKVENSSKLYGRPCCMRVFTFLTIPSHDFIIEYFSFRFLRIT